MYDGVWVEIMKCLRDVTKEVAFAIDWDILLVKVVK